MATLDDTLTAHKNGVVAINNLSSGVKTISELYQYSVGQFRSDTVSTRTQVASGSGRLVAINVITAGSTTGIVYDTILLNVTGVTGDGTKATIIYAPAFSVVVGDTIFITGIDPAGYNETAGDSVTDVVSTTSFKYPNITSSAYVSGGTIFVNRAKEKISSVPNTIGNYTIGSPFSTGLVIDPGTSQVVNVIYSLD